MGSHQSSSGPEVAAEQEEEGGHGTVQREYSLNVEVGGVSNS